MSAAPPSRVAEARWPLGELASELKAALDKTPLRERVLAQLAARGD